MSVKIMGLVWDLDLPQNEKFVLLAYADHADHDGRNIFPAVQTIAKKTGYSERSIQGITRTLEEKGFLIADGKGPKGTNKWKFYGGANSAGGQPEAKGVQLEAGGVQSATQRGAIAIAPEPSLTIIKEPSIKPSDDTQRKRYKLLAAENWKLGMCMDYVPWEGRSSKRGRVGKKEDWLSFLDWLTEKEIAGYSVTKFCEWFMSDKFRSNTISMWSPEGRPIEGAYFFKTAYMLAFQSNGNGQKPEKQETTMSDWLSLETIDEIDLTEIPQETLDRIVTGICDECEAEGDCIPIKGGLLCLEHFRLWRIDNLGLDRQKGRTYEKMQRLSKRNRKGPNVLQKM